MERLPLILRVNGREESLLVAQHKTLLEVLREDLGLTGAKEGCEDGTCGTCTILLDGRPIRSCLLLAAEAQGHGILTIEGLGDEEHLHPLQKAFINYGGIQCGFCTPGMILTAKAFLDRNPSPTKLDVREAISGNLCRCTGYTKIVESILAVASEESST